jgi:hypothetical protein
MKFVLDASVALLWLVPQTNPSRVVARGIGDCAPGSGCQIGLDDIVDWWLLSSRARATGGRYLAIRLSKCGAEIVGDGGNDGEL